MQVLADHCDRVGVLERRRTGEQMKSRGGQRILVRAAVDVGTRQLLGRRVGHRPHRDIGLGDTADVGEVARYAEVRQQDSAFPVLGVGEQDVGGLDVAVQQAAVVCVVERAGDGLQDGAHLMDRHPVPVALLDQSGGIGPLDVVHGNPELTVEFAAIVDADDVRVPQRCRKVGLAVEPLAELGIRGDRLGEHLDHVATGQPGVQCQIDLGHAAGAELPQDRVAGKRRTAGEGKARSAGLGVVLYRRRLGVRGRVDGRNAAKQVRDRRGRYRLKARAQGRTGQTRVAQQPSPGINAPGGPFVSLPSVVTPSFLGT